MAVPGEMHVKLGDLVYQEIRRRILEREFEPGQRLVERSLAEEMDVSRVPVREALKILVRDGLVEERPRAGMRVTEVSAEELDEIIEIAHLLDGLTFRRMARNLDEAARAKAEKLLKQTREAIEKNNRSAAIALNAKFHELAREIAGSKFLNVLLEQVDTRLLWLLTQHEDPQAFLRAHEQLLTAMIAGDEHALETAIMAHAQASQAAAHCINQ